MTNAFDEQPNSPQPGGQGEKPKQEPTNSEASKPKNGRWDRLEVKGAAGLRNFLSRVVPWPVDDEPGYISLHWHLPGQPFLGRSFRSIDEFIKIANEFAHSKKSNLYFCLSRQAKKAVRDIQNALAFRSIWLDIDIKLKGYPTIEAAIEALFDFIQHYNLPPPSAIVLSGNGLHVYWFSNRPLSYAEWHPYAEGLKAAALQWGLRCDAGLMANGACVLRIPGTLNFKTDPPKPVRLYHLMADDIDFSKTLAPLKEIAPTTGKTARTKTANPGPPFNGAKVSAAFAHLKPAPLGEGIEDYPPLPFAPIKAECAWLREAYDTGGKDHDNPQWHLTVLAATFFENGHELAHQLGNEHPDYTLEETEQKWDEKIRAHKENGVGWPSCKAIRDAQPAGQPSVCDQCPHFALGKSPLNLADQARPNWRREYEERAARRRTEQIRQNIEIGDDVAELAVPLILTPKEMIERLVWIGFSGAVVDRVTFRIRKNEQAAAEYAASVYYPKEEEEEDKEQKEEKEGAKSKAKTKKPKSKPKPKQKPIPCLNIWMRSPMRTTVDALAWVPGGPQICRPPENFNNAQTAFNTWRGIAPMPMVENWQERCEPFLDHVAYLVPVESERQRFMQWLAHIIQQPEVLPHTSYLMVTPKTGIGRNWMASVLVRVLRGYVAAGVSLPELLDGGFNGRLSCKLLAIVDELREGPSSRRYERGQRLKSIITEENRLINPKFGIQSIEKNCCRWLKFSNFFDALPFDNTDRRIETIANPTMRKTVAYYEYIYSLLHDPEFIASVWWLLKTMDISDFKPGAHAAMNEAKERALVEMMTDVERAVHDFKDECVTALASRKDIEAAAGSSQQLVNAAHLTHAITHADMINTGRRVMDAFGVRHPVVIVDTARWTTEMVKAASAGTLFEAMGKPITPPKRPTWAV